MQPLLLYSEDYLQHKTAGHPESPERLLAILNRLQTENLLPQLKLIEPSPIDQAFLQRMHHPAYIAQFEAFCRRAGSGIRIDEDTVVSEGSFAAALKAAGAAVSMVEYLSNDSAQSVFSLVRPPGHHAMPQHLMGFCFFNNVALAALYALEKRGLQRVAILDWDAHHGNGTEHLFYQDPRVLTVSWHQSPNWPGTGLASDQGQGAGLGYSLNIPLPLQSGEEAFICTLNQLVLPALQRFQPQLVLVSAGYDAHHADVLTQMGMTATGFSRLTEALMQGLEKLGSPKIGFILEGGYQLEALSASVYATLNTLVQEQAVEQPEALGPAPLAPDLQQLEPLISTLQNSHPQLKEERAP